MQIDPAATAWLLACTALVCVHCAPQKRPGFS